MYMKYVRKKKLLKTVDNVDKELPALDPSVVIEKFVAYLNEHNISSILYHGEDHLCLESWSRNYYDENCFAEFKMYDTSGFWRGIRSHKGSNKYGIKTIVAEYWDSVVRERYDQDSHSALTDAYCLAQLSVNHDKFHDWHTGKWYQVELD